MLFWNHYRSDLETTGFHRCLEEPKVWERATTTAVVASIAAIVVADMIQLLPEQGHKV